MDPVALAERYVELSNAHDLKAVFPLFADDASYLSSQVGAYEGRAAIEAMMRDFFARYDDAYWCVQTYRPVGDDGAEFDFVMTADGGAVERRGREQIRFTPAGLIRRVEVEVSATAR